MSSAVAFSPRFTRAAAAERERLAGRLAKAKTRARERKGELAAAEADVAELEARLEALVPVLGEPAPEHPAPTEAPAGLRGQAIREVAVEVLLRCGAQAGPIHYRDWLGLVESEAGPVAGKRAEAVFLNQVTRHPLVRATTSRGFYELDPGAAVRLEARVGELRTALAAATAAEAAAVTPPGRRRGSRALALELGRAERALGEARHALPTGVGASTR